jgi:hypothetical protein
MPTPSRGSASAQTREANRLLIYGEDWPSISHTLSPPPLDIVWDESNDDEYWATPTLLYYTTSQESIPGRTFRILQSDTFQWPTNRTKKTDAKALNE